MKKQFFYAIMTLTVISSCPEDNDPGISNPKGNDDKAVIVLGLDVPTVTASTRSTGSVGDVAGNQSIRNSQKLYIYMADRSTGLEAEEGAESVKTKILDNGALEFRAPKTDAEDKGAIRICKSYVEDSDNGIIQYKYYPTNGQYAFYGYHIDGATNANPSITAAEKKITGVVVDGTQDLSVVKIIGMAENDASTIDPGSSYRDIATSLGGKWAALMNCQSGVRIAHKNIVPVLKLERQLARLKPFVRAGSGSATDYEWQTNRWVGRKDGDAGPKTLGMQVTRTTLKNMANVVDTDLTVPSPTGDRVSVADPVVCSKDDVADGKLDPIKGLIAPVVPKYPYEDRNTPESDPDTEDIQVGESVVFFPTDGTNNEGDTILFIDFKQYIEDAKDEAAGTIAYKEAEKTDSKLTIEQSKISETTQKFMPGTSYNVYITIYGFEKIEVTTVSTAWEDGGDTDANTEDGK